jgi:hypothetical protein
MYLVLLLAAAGLAQWPRWNWAMVTLGAVLGVGGAWRYVQDQISLPDLKVDYDVAKFLDRSLKDDETALLLVPPITDDERRLFLDKARETGGDEGLRKARQELESVSATPPDYQRVAVHSRLGRDRLLTPPAGCAEWVVVWNDDPDAIPKAGVTPVQVFRAGATEVSIFQRNCATTK